VLVDLAVQAAGLVAEPVGDQGQQGLQGRQGRQVVVEGERVELSGLEEAEGAGMGLPAVERFAAGGAVVGEAVVLQDDLVAAAERLGRLIPEPAAGRRHILVLGGFAGDPAERALLSWATVAGAALLLEPDPPAYLSTAVWARPTVFAGTPAELIRLRATVERDEAGLKIFRRKHRLPFGRLGAVLVTGGELPPEEVAFWDQRGVEVGDAAERQERGI
jgi:hypothetical protein